MIIPVKLKPFSEWPCDREGLPESCWSRRHEAYDKLSGIEIELDDARRSKCARGGRAWGVTDETLQRMYAIGLIAPYAWIPRPEALAIRICEHLIQPWSLRAGLLLAKFRQRRRPRLVQYGRCGKFFCRIWNEDGSGPIVLGKVTECLGGRGLPLYRAELFPESQRIRGDNSSEYLFGETDLQTWHWHYFDSEGKMRAFINRLDGDTRVENEEPKGRPN
jgi:hypothetical protein